MTTKPMMLIVGAGIGGISVALALRQAGFGVVVFERAAALNEIGAGIAPSANAIRVLKQLGLMQPVVDRGTMIESVISDNSRGGMIGRVPTNLTDVPSVCLQRADQQQALFSALPPDCVQLGEQFVHFEKAGEGGLSGCGIHFFV